jgi:hypothetical protein
MIRNFFVKNFLTNFPQNFSNKLALAGGVKLLCRKAASYFGVLEDLSFLISDYRLTRNQFPATTFRALKSENRCTPLLQRSKYIRKYPKALSGPVDIPGLGLTGGEIHFR